MTENEYMEEILGGPDDISPQEREYDFRMRQRKLVVAHEKRKEREAELAQMRKEYWKDVKWQQDVAYDGSDDQEYEPQERGD